MKQIVSIFLLLIYAFSSNGATINLHYCGDAIASISLNEKVSMDCCAQNKQQAAAMDAVKKPSCCSDQVIQLRISPNQRTSEINYDITAKVQVASLPSPPFCLYVLQHLPTAQKVVVFDNNLPPNGWRTQPIYLLFQRFTFYG